MTDDLVKRLRSPANVFYEYAADGGAFLREAADRLEQLESSSEGWKEIADEYFDAICERNTRIEKLEAALREIASIDSYYVSDIVDFARKALEGKDDAD